MEKIGERFNSPGVENQKVIKRLATKAKINFFKIKDLKRFLIK